MNTPYHVSFSRTLAIVWAVEFVREPLGWEQMFTMPWWAALLVLLFLWFGYEVSLRRDRQCARS